MTAWQVMLALAGTVAVLAVADRLRDVVDRTRGVPSRRRSTLARLLLAAVRAYRHWISPVRPPSCRFTPSCSAYAVEAIETHGAVRGGWLATRRLLRCGPWHPGGHDPVPPAVGRAGGSGEMAGDAASTRHGHATDRHSATERHSATVSTRTRADGQSSTPTGAPRC